MHTAWQFLNTRNAHIEADVVCDFGDVAAELRAAESGQPVVAPLVDRASIRVTGEDATSFLHRLLTQDIETLTMASARRAGFCTAKGRLLASFLVWREDAEPPSYRLELPAELLSPIRAKLSMYVLRSAVKLSDGREDRALIGLAGVDGASLLDALGLSWPEADLAISSNDGLTLIRLETTRALLSVPVAGLEAAWDRLSAVARPVGTPAWHGFDVRAGIADIVLATQDEYVPQMLNLDVTGGISFKKGCYPGQEVVARTHYLGKVKRRMWRAQLGTAAGAAARIGDPIVASALSDQVCGGVVASAPCAAGETDLLVVIQESALAGTLHLGSADGPPIRVEPPPYALP